MTICWIVSHFRSTPLTVQRSSCQHGSAPAVGSRKLDRLMKLGRWVWGLNALALTQDHVWAPWYYTPKHFIQATKHNLSPWWWALYSKPKHLSSSGVNSVQMIMCSSQQRAMVKQLSQRRGRMFGPGQNQLKPVHDEKHSPEIASVSWSQFLISSAEQWAIKTFLPPTQAGNNYTGLIIYHWVRTETVALLAHMKATLTHKSYFSSIFTVAGLRGFWLCSTVEKFNRPWNVLVLK